MRYKVFFKHFVDDSDSDLAWCDFVNNCAQESRCYAVVDVDCTGITLCTIEKEKKKPFVKSYTFCSYRDQFCKAQGRFYSIRRALIKLYKSYGIKEGDEFVLPFKYRIKDSNSQCPVVVKITKGNNPIGQVLSYFRRGK